MLPERLDATYVGEDGARHRPVMLHRAVFGSFERFIGLLIEHYAGRFPLWLAPRQAVVAPIISEPTPMPRRWSRRSRPRGPRRGRPRNEKINYKGGGALAEEVPLLLVVGKREAEEGTIALRRLGSEERQLVMTVDEALSMIAEGAVPLDWGTERLTTLRHRLEQK